MGKGRVRGRGRVVRWPPPTPTPTPTPTLTPKVAAARRGVLRHRAQQRHATLLRQAPSPLHLPSSSPSPSQACYASTTSAVPSRASPVVGAGPRGGGARAPRSPPPSRYLPASPHISPHLPTPPRISPHLPTSPHTSPHLPTPPHISPISPQVQTPFFGMLRGTSDADLRRMQAGDIAEM